MKRPTPPKSRKPADRPRVTVRETCDHDAPQHGFAPGHMGGIFEDAGYGTRHDQFGFRQYGLEIRARKD